MPAGYPAFVRVYDLLAVDGKDLRGLPWTERRRQLEAFVPRLAASHFDLSPVIEAAHFDELAELRAGARDAAIVGDRKRTRLNSQSLMRISYAVYCLNTKIK